MDETIKSINEERQSAADKSVKQYNELRAASTDFFAKYDQRMETLEMQASLMSKKYEEWSKVLIEPTSLNVARLYALETRLHEEETLRIKENQFVSENMKRLIYTLNNQKKETNTVQKDDDLPYKLPSLNTTKASMLRTEMSKYEPMKENKLFKQRLNYINTSLDQYDPLQTQAMIQNKYQNTKSEKLWDIWKTDQELPNVNDIVQHMKSNYGENYDKTKKSFDRRIE